MSRIARFEDLRLWQQAQGLVSRIYDAVGDCRF